MSLLNVQRVCPASNAAGIRSYEGAARFAARLRRGRGEVEPDEAEPDEVEPDEVEPDEVEP